MGLLKIIQGKIFTHVIDDVETESFMYLFDNDYVMIVDKHDDTNEVELYEIELGKIIDNNILKSPIEPPFFIKQTSYITDIVVNNIILQIQSL